MKGCLKGCIWSTVIIVVLFFLIGGIIAISGTKSSTNYHDSSIEAQAKKEMDDEKRAKIREIERLKQENDDLWREIEVERAKARLSKDPEASEHEARAYMYETAWKGNVQIIEMKEQQLY